MNAVAPGRLIGRGLTSDVLEWDANRVLKLAFEGRPRAQLEVEFKVSRAIHAAGIPSPATYELVEVNGRIGIVFERIDGISMFHAVQYKPWTLRSASRDLAELHAQMHSTKAPRQLPTQREQFERWIDAAHDLSSDRLAAAREALVHIRSDEFLCHGDFHPQNIIYSSKGPIVIDWSTGTRGDPIADVARTSSLFLLADIPPDTTFHMRLLIHVFRRLVNQIYLSRYFQLRPGSAKQLAAYAPLQEAAQSAWRTRRIN